MRRSTDRRNAQTETIEVPASDFGLGVNPLVIRLIADRLARAEGAWKPFDAEAGFRRPVFRRR